MVNDLPAAGPPASPALDLPALAQAIGRTANASAVFGEPVHHGDVVIIPVARAAWGLGRGGRGSRNGGGGLRIEPAGFIELRSGAAAFRPIRPNRLPAVLPFAIVALAVAAGAFKRRGRVA